MRCHSQSLSQVILSLGWLNLCRCIEQLQDDRAQGISKLTSLRSCSSCFENLEAVGTSSIFSEIYDHRLWGKGLDGGPFSGPGSHNPQVVDPYIASVRKFVSNTFAIPPDAVDLGCGDFNVGRQIRNVTDHYVACDIVPDVVNYNRLLFAQEAVDFRILDMVTEDLPAGDVVFVRQVLQHLSNSQISTLLPKLNRYKWLIVTESLPYQEVFEPNHDIETGEFIRMDSDSGVDLTTIAVEYSLLFSQTPVAAFPANLNI